MYKSHLLSFLEYRPPAIYHAKREALGRLDSVQDRFLREAGIDDITALMKFNLAPLATRRDIAMLGLIHRTVLKKGPLHFRDQFQRETSPPPGVTRHHCRHLVDPRLSHQGRVIGRSALGLAAVYNLLPPIRGDDRRCRGLPNGSPTHHQDQSDGWPSGLGDDVKPKAVFAHSPANWRPATPTAAASSRRC